MKKPTACAIVAFLCVVSSAWLVPGSLAGAQPAEALAPRHVPVSRAYLDYVRERAALARSSASSTSTEAAVPLRAKGKIPSRIRLIEAPKLGAVAALWDTRAKFPAKFDLRRKGKLTDIRHQGDCGTCWAFASIGSLESSLMPRFPTNFSENNLRNTHGFDYTPCEGGNREMSAAYFTRWSGPVLETDDSYPDPEGDDYDKPSPPGLLPSRHVQEIAFIPDRPSPLENHSLKEAIMKLGPVETGLRWDEGYEKGDTYYYPGKGVAPSADYTDHTVCLVGWDDDYPRAKFVVHPPPGPGAFLIRNSWGCKCGDQGYYYVSYYDRFVGTDNAAYLPPLDPTNYAGQYAYDPLGVEDLLSWDDPVWYAALFHVREEDAGNTLAAVGLYTWVPHATCEIRVYADGTSDPTTGASLTNRRTAGPFRWPGYHTVRLRRPVPLLPGHTFAVVVHETSKTETGRFLTAIEQPVEGYSSRADAAPGECFYSDDCRTWADLVTVKGCEKASFCLKAFTETAR